MQEKRKKIASRVPRKQFQPQAAANLNMVHYDNRSTEEQVEKPVVEKKAGQAQANVVNMTLAKKD
jgi:hypothetical protein